MSDFGKTTPWLTIIGCGEDGPAGLTDASRKAIADAKHIIGAPRHLEVLDLLGDPFPVPFSIAPVIAKRGEATVMLTSGDPFWFGAGGSIAAQLDPSEYICHSAPSVFSMIAARMGWRLEETLCMGLHAKSFSRLLPLASDGVQIIATLRDGAAISDLGAYLTESGFRDSVVTCFQSLGGYQEQCIKRKASELSQVDLHHPVAVAIDCIGRGISRASGLADELFATDGQITKRPVRALTLSALAPCPNEIFWDIGAGSGSITVEMLLAAPGSRGFALETRADRIENIRKNADHFGIGHRVEVINAHAPAGLDDLPAPDAIFIGGGLNAELFDALWAKMPDGARLVANTVTLESEALITQLAGKLGGELMRFDFAQAAPLGRMRGWQAARPVVQWRVVK
ncbi:precorrin-6Y C5,15-methyltransferase (decarboxylating) subunit CbiT [Halocynthiibacter sp.]|uniref:precorrin-6Y C5,15-methyltransferase (decarboxylating) subunit CbiT n=1 Tax=Halocynthiibacter sp. TaxID=1979210 RepID=UPI003C3D71BC